MHWTVVDDHARVSRMPVNTDRIATAQVPASRNGARP
jgi:hypothetical protein